MRPAPQAPELLKVARRVVWFKAPEEALKHADHFLAHVMTYGTDEDVVTVRRHFTDADLTRVLDNPPPGIFDERSWSYWNLIFGRSPPPPLPRRETRLAKLPES